MGRVSALFYLVASEVTCLFGSFRELRLHQNSINVRSQRRGHPVKHTNELKGPTGRRRVRTEGEEMCLPQGCRASIIDGAQQRRFEVRCISSQASHRHPTLSLCTPLGGQVV